MIDAAGIARLIDYACVRRGCSEPELAHWMGLSISAFRAWRKRDAPRYVALALSAITAGVEL